jgi:hypothetical protein
MLLQTVVPLDEKMDRLLQGGSSSTLYNIVGALTFFSFAKKSLEKYATS